MISVLFAIPELDRGGPDRVVFEIMKGLDRKRFEPRLLVSSGTGHYLSLLPRDIPVEVLGGGRSFSDRYPGVRVLRFIRGTRPDIVFATQRMIVTLGIVSSLLPRRTRLVLRQANDLSADWAALVSQSFIKHRLARQLAVAMLRRADAVICQSDAMRRDLGATLRDDSRLHVIFNPVDVDAVAGAVAPGVRAEGAPALVSMGRLAPQKGHDILLAAFATLRAKAPEAHLTIYGDGPDREALQAQAVSLGIAGAVTFAGFTSAPLSALRAADLFVLASRYEGFPNAALEALACGTPVVLTNCPGANSEIVVPGVNGRLASAVDPVAVAEALQLAVAELRKYDRAGIQSDCRARFSSDQIVRAYERVLMQVAP